MNQFSLNNNNFVKWATFYQQHLKEMYRIFKYHTNKLNTPYKPFTFNEFCNFIYKKSSKRISLY